MGSLVVTRAVLAMVCLEEFVPVFWLGKREPMVWLWRKEPMVWLWKEVPMFWLERLKEILVMVLMELENYWMEVKIYDVLVNLSSLTQQYTQTQNSWQDPK